MDRYYRAPILLYKTVSTVHKSDITFYLEPQARSIGPVGIRNWAAHIGNLGGHQGHQIEGKQLLIN